MQANNREKYTLPLKTANTGYWEFETNDALNQQRHMVTSINLSEFLIEFNHGDKSLHIRPGCYREEPK